MRLKNFIFINTIILYFLISKVGKYNIKKVKEEKKIVEKIRSIQW